MRSAWSTGRRCRTIASACMFSTSPSSSSAVYVPRMLKADVWILPYSAFASTTSTPFVFLVHSSGLARLQGTHSDLLRVPKVLNPSALERLQDLLQGGVPSLCHLVLEQVDNHRKGACLIHHQLEVEDLLSHGDHEVVRLHHLPQLVGCLCCGRSLCRWHVSFLAIFTDHVLRDHQQLLRSSSALSASRLFGWGDQVVDVVASGPDPSLPVPDPSTPASRTGLDLRPLRPSPRPPPCSCPGTCPSSRARSTQPHRVQCQVPCPKSTFTFSMDSPTSIPTGRFHGWPTAS